MEKEGKGHYKEWRKRERGTVRNGEREGKGHYKEWRKRGKGAL